jgi:hypothetical protein
MLVNTQKRRSEKLELWAHRFEVYFPILLAILLAAGLVTRVYALTFEIFTRMAGAL